MQLDESLLEKQNATDLVTLLITVTEADQLDLLLDWFLYTYSPEKQWDLLQQNAEALKNPQLLELVVSKVAEQYQPEIFLETVNLLSSIDNYERAIVDSGVLRWVVLSMGRDEDNPRSQQLGCKLLACLAINPAIRNYFALCGATKAVIYALKNHQENAAVLLEVYKALTNIGFRSRVNKELFIREKVIDSILEVTEMFHEDVRVVNEGLMTLRSIIVNELLTEHQQHVVVRDILLKMLEFKDIPEIQVNSLWILVLLLTGSDMMKRHAISQLGALIHIFRAMETYPDNPYIQLPGALALALVSKVATNRSKIADSGTLGVLVLVNAMRKWIDDIDIQRATTKALFRLAFSKEIREDLGQNGTIEDAVRTMHRHLDNYPVQRNCCILLHQLSKSSTISYILSSSSIQTSLSEVLSLIGNRYASKEAFQPLVYNLTQIINGNPSGIKLKLKITKPSMPIGLSLKIGSINENSEDVATDTYRLTPRDIPPDDNIEPRSDPEQDGESIEDIIIRSINETRNIKGTKPPTQSAPEDERERRRKERDERRRRALEEVNEPPVRPRSGTGAPPVDIKPNTASSSVPVPTPVPSSYAATPVPQRDKQLGLLHRTATPASLPFTPSSDPASSPTETPAPEPEATSSGPTSAVLPGVDDLLRRRKEREERRKRSIGAQDAPVVETTPPAVVAAAPLPTDSAEEDSIARRRREREERRKLLGITTPPAPTATPEPTTAPPIPTAQATQEIAQNSTAPTTQTTSRPRLGSDTNSTQKYSAKPEELTKTNTEGQTTEGTSVVEPDISVVSAVSTVSAVSAVSAVNTVSAVNEEEDDPSAKRRREREERRKRMEEERIAEEMKWKEEREKRRIEREEQKKKQEEEEKQREEERRKQRDERRKQIQSIPTSTDTSTRRRRDSDQEPTTTPPYSPRTPIAADVSRSPYRSSPESDTYTTNNRRTTTEASPPGKNDSNSPLSSDKIVQDSPHPFRRRSPDLNDTVIHTEQDSPYRRKQANDSSTYEPDPPRRATSERSVASTPSPVNRRATGIFSPVDTASESSAEDRSAERRRKEREMERTKQSTDYDSPYGRTNRRTDTTTDYDRKSTPTQDASRTTRKATDTLEESPLERRRREREERNAAAATSTVTSESRSARITPGRRTEESDDKYGSRRYDSKKQEEQTKEELERQQRLDERKRRREQLRSGND